MPARWYPGLWPTRCQRNIIEPGGGDARRAFVEDRESQYRGLSPVAGQIEVVGIGNLSQSGCIHFYFSLSSPAIGSTSELILQNDSYLLLPSFPPLVRELLCPSLSYLHRQRWTVDHSHS